jgi:hypothetical protein
MSLDLEAPPAVIEDQVARVAVHDAVVGAELDRVAGRRRNDLEDLLENSLLPELREALALGGVEIDALGRRDTGGHCQQENRERDSLHSGSSRICREFPRLVSPRHDDGIESALQLIWYSKGTLCGASVKKNNQSETTA